MEEENLNQKTQRPEPVPVETPAPSPEPPEFKARKWPFVVIGILLLIILLMSGFFLATKKTAVEPKPTPAVSEQISPSQLTTTPSISPETADWKLYANTQNGYSVKFPDDQFVRMNCPNEGLVLKVRTAADASIDEDKVLETCARDGRFDIEMQNYDSMPPEINTEPKGYNVTKENITIDGVSAVKRTITPAPDCFGLCAPDWQVEIRAVNNGKNYVFYLTNQKYTDTFDKILSTFKFTQ